MVLLAIKGVVLVGRRREAMASFHTLPTFSQGLIRLVVETPKGAAAKFTYEPKADVFEFGRALPAGLIYPYDWGFIPSTVGADGDALDGLVVHHTVTAPGIVIHCRLLGALMVEQTEEGRSLRNDRFVLYPAKESADDAAQSGVPPRLKREIEQFFHASILGSNRTIRVDGWQSADDALKAIKKGQAAFKRKHRARK
jgi:inorganic pyrophosphatase